MILKVGLAIKKINGFQQLVDEPAIHTHILTQSDIEEPHFVHSLMDLIVWQPEFSRGIFPQRLIDFFTQNKAAALIIYNTAANEFKLPDSVSKNLISIVESPIKKHTLKLLMYNAALVKKQRSLDLVEAESDRAISDDELIGNSPEINKIREFINFIAKSSNTNCLITGDIGTEKYKIARMIHHKGKKDQRLIQIINCANFSEDEMMIKLFGAEFPDEGSELNQWGSLELSSEGTLVLGNIESISQDIQNRLESYLDTHQFRRVGSDTDIEVETRVIATSDYDLEKFVTDGDFSRELYFRLKAFELTLPPLRRRKNDILTLVNYYIDYYNRKFGHEVSGLSPETERAALEYDWPGNVNELRLVIERALLLHKKGEINLSLLPSDIDKRDKFSYETQHLGNCSLRDIERMHIEKALLRTKGNKSKAAQLLQISRTTLREKLRIFDLQH